MKVKDNRNRIIVDMFNRFVRSSDFNGVFYPGQFYQFCQRQGHKHINHKHLYLTDINLEDLAKIHNLKYRKNAPNKSTQNRLIYLLSEGFSRMKPEFLEKTRMSKKDWSHIFPDGYDLSEAKRYIGLVTLVKLCSKTIDLDDIPAWTREDGSEILTNFANSKTQCFKLFLQTFRLTSKLPKLKVSTRVGYIYVRVIDYTIGLEQGWILIKVGLSGNKSFEEASKVIESYQFIQTHIFNTKNIDAAESKLLDKMNNDLLAKRFNGFKDSKSQNKREYFIVPHSHLSVILDYASQIAKKQFV